MRIYAGLMWEQWRQSRACVVIGTAAIILFIWSGLMGMPLVSLENQDHLTSMMEQGATSQEVMLAASRQVDTSMVMFSYLFQLGVMGVYFIGFWKKWDSTPGMRVLPYGYVEPALP